MYPPIFQLVRDYPPAVALLGPSPVRFWPFGKVPEAETRPYAFHQLVYGNPDNSLSCLPKEDLLGIQVDAYAKTQSDARAVAEAIRDACELAYNHVVAWNGEDWEQSTGLWRVSFTAEFWTPRT